MPLGIRFFRLFGLLSDKILVNSARLSRMRLKMILNYTIWKR